jgi:hypothetical protein
MTRVIYAHLQGEGPLDEDDPVAVRTDDSGEFPDEYRAPFCAWMAEVKSAVYTFEDELSPEDALYTFSHTEKYPS